MTSSHPFPLVSGFSINALVYKKQKSIHSRTEVLSCNIALIKFFLDVNNFSILRKESEKCDRITRNYEIIKKHCN